MKICAFDNDTECSILRKKNCVGCSFCKTKEEVAASKEKALDRLSSLPEAKQIYIRRKYYS